MPPKSVKRAIAEALDDLSEEQVKRFCSAVRDRKEEPRIRLADLEGKSRPEIARVLVQFHTEVKAKEVALETLGEIGCNQQKKNLGEFNTHKFGVTRDLGMVFAFSFSRALALHIHSLTLDFFFFTYGLLIFSLNNTIDIEHSVSRISLSLYDGICR